ncbi:hypothetical protein BHU25_08090 [Pseudomonas vranovensis]|uniref:Uncharacterized protein n=1 Tax=Pseudomonas vranovensis TaxID=321661 RepID=A0A423DUF0_9PSED|nr:hypothetical protein BHU25_08090 [Pseudomonas vranovensis]
MPEEVHLFRQMGPVSERVQSSKWEALKSAWVLAAEQARMGQELEEGLKSEVSGLAVEQVLGREVPERASV